MHPGLITRPNCALFYDTPPSLALFNFANYVCMEIFPEHGIGSTLLQSMDPVFSVFCCCFGKCSVSPPSVMARVGFGVGLGSMGVGYLLWGACVHYPHLKLKMSDVIPPNEVVSYPGDQPWHVPFPSPPGTPNNDPTSSGSESDNIDPLKKIAEVKHHL
ncbi:hypothetical protein L3X38_013430 [Prunus dulcis]|uniref:Uncharacterized protein n=1 Tax=Prunus dulcis TaxID=3755 RepID=A0AAD4WLW4_PRUDU|nr:hypothetical protein L3X38_013430 [Prunus dulcis]